jgi:branched-subunit amino acid aminotransferase/4-amino-4-deoxychorismate lyase
LLTLETLAHADEVFLTNSVVGTRPVAALIERWQAAEVPGPVTELLARRYAQLVREECGLKE